jgi:hypothetical protein
MRSTDPRSGLFLLRSLIEAVLVGDRPEEFARRHFAVVVEIQVIEPIAHRLGGLFAIDAAVLILVEAGESSAPPARIEKHSTGSRTRIRRTICRLTLRTFAAPAETLQGAREATFTAEPAEASKARAARFATSVATFAAVAVFALRPIFRTGAIFAPCAIVARAVSILRPGVHHSAEAFAAKFPSLAAIFVFMIGRGRMLARSMPLARFALLAIMAPGDMMHPVVVMVMNVFAVFMMIAIGHPVVIRMMRGHLMGRAVVTHS